VGLSVELKERSAEAPPEAMPAPFIVLTQSFSQLHEQAHPQLQEGSVSSVPPADDHDITSNIDIHLLSFGQVLIVSRPRLSSFCLGQESCPVPCP